MTEKIYYFGFRMEKQLHYRIKAYLMREKISLRVFAMKSFQYASKKHNRRLINFSGCSRFKARMDKKNKVDLPFVQTEKQREVVRSFAFSYRLSMAEVFRISMEAYLDQIEADNGRLDEVKHIYRNQVPIKEATLAVIYPAFHVIFPLDYHLHPD